MTFLPPPLRHFVVPAPMSFSVAQTRSAPSFPKRFVLSRTQLVNGCGFFM